MRLASSMDFCSQSPPSARRKSISRRFTGNGSSPNSARPARAAHPLSISIIGVAISMTPVSKYTAPLVGR